MKSLLALLLFVGLAASAARALDPAKGRFDYTQAGLTVTVWHYVPPAAGPQAPVVFVLPGIKRNGEDYLNDWIPLAQAGGFLLVVPEFSQAEFPGDEGYIYGNTVDRAGRPVPREQWSFSMIEPIFDAVRARTGNRSERYCLYGHSAGAQFVQRFIYFVPQARLARAVAANAGWYMMPDLAADFPYGLKGTPVNADDLRHALGLPLVVLLGTADTNANDKVLRHTPQADAQGPYRFARGQFFFSGAARAAQAQGLPFHWQLATAPGIGHSDPGMAPFAIHWLLSNP
jgi:poly(3-hydroxybutyrate) depolymerase